MIKDIVIIGAGGGGAKFGLKNYVKTFHFNPKNGFTKEIDSKELQSIPVYIDLHEGLNLFCACADSTTFIYKMSSNGMFNEIFACQANDYWDKQFIYQAICKFIPEVNVICTGMTDGNLK